MPSKNQDDRGTNSPPSLRDIKVPIPVKITEYPNYMPSAPPGSKIYVYGDPPSTFGCIMQMLVILGVGLALFFFVLFVVIPVLDFLG